jgi:glycosyltransferase involved in cell wall biosynthesis
VIGRHSRPSPQKWPTDPKIIEAVYPVDGSAIVRILGGADPVRDVLGYVPESWQVMPFGAVDPREFLAQLDFFVYYHHPAWVEAFGRNILEAMASGLPAILPPHFRRLFGDSAIYAEPADVPSLVSRLYSDRPAFEDIVAARNPLFERG